MIYMIAEKGYSSMTRFLSRVGRRRNGWECSWGRRVAAPSFGGVPQLVES